MVKRLFDVVAALAALMVLSPVMLIVAVLVRIKLGSPVLFRQERPGLNCRIFTMYKFRTMIAKTHDDAGQLLPDEKRLTPFGRWLRATSLDELPELFNVLKGDMSLVGPRPLMVKYLPRYTPEQNRRHEVKPGITGWAQVNGLRGETETVDKMKARVEYDLEYLRNWSLGLDLQIIVRTIRLLFFDRNAY